MEPTQAKVKRRQMRLAYTTEGQIQEVAKDYFTIDGLGSRFHCSHDFLPYDRVKIIITKLEEPDALPDRHSLPDGKAPSVR